MKDTDIISQFALSLSDRSHAPDIAVPGELRRSSDAGFDPLANFSIKNVEKCAVKPEEDEAAMEKIYSLIAQVDNILYKKDAAEKIDFTSAIDFLNQQYPTDVEENSPLFSRKAEGFSFCDKFENLLQCLDGSESTEEREKEDDEQFQDEIEEEDNQYEEEEEEEEDKDEEDNDSNEDQEIDSGSDNDEQSESKTAEIQEEQTNSKTDIPPIQIVDEPKQNEDDNGFSTRMRQITNIPEIKHTLNEGEIQKRIEDVRKEFEIFASLCSKGNVPPDLKACAQRIYNSVISLVKDCGDDPDLVPVTQNASTLATTLRILTSVKISLADNEDNCSEHANDNDERILKVAEILLISLVKVGIRVECQNLQMRRKT